MVADPLAGLPRPLGDPGAMTALGSSWTKAGHSLMSSGQVMTGMTGRVLAQTWSGPAALACAGSCAKDAGLLGMTAGGYQAGGQALTTYGHALAAAQALWDRARIIANEAMAEERAYAAGHPPAGSPAPSSSGPSMPALIGGQPVAPATPPSFAIPGASYVSPLAAVAQGMARQAISDAKAAATRAVGQLEGTLKPFEPPPPAKPTAQHHSSHWYSPITSFGSGLYDGVKDPVVMVGGLVGLHGSAGQNWENLWGGIKYGGTHPLTLGEGLIDWQDLKQGHFSHWAGELAPTVVATVLSGGGAAGLKGADALSVTAKTGETLDDLSEADRAVLAARGDDLVPGSIGPDSERLEVGADGTYDYSSKFAQNVENDFARVDVNGKITLQEDKVLYSLHDGSPLHEWHTLKYGATSEDVLGSSKLTYMRKLALDPSWSPRTHMTILVVPKGAEVDVAVGTTEAQTAHLAFGKVVPKVFGHKIPIGRLAGGGTQVLFKHMDPTWAVWTGQAPWLTTGQVAARAAAGGATVRVPDVLADLQAGG